MEAISQKHLRKLSFEYEVDGKTLKRNAIDKKADECGTQWVLVETTGDRHAANKQWVELNFFKQWIIQMSAAA
ncbi:hypothetical protein [Ekhidna sp.]|uniref:hypothetical protein n=1 Tax=Ekhidna sp. TaxID=2608089 RepID=UPI0032996766